MSRSRQVKNRYDYVREILFEVLVTNLKFPPELQQMILAYFVDFLRLRDPATGELIRLAYCPTIYFANEYLPLVYDGKTLDDHFDADEDWTNTFNYKEFVPFVNHLIRFTRLSPDGKLPVPAVDHKNEAKSLSINTPKVDASTPLISSDYKTAEKMDWVVTVKDEKKEEIAIQGVPIARHKAFQRSQEYLLHHLTDDKAYQMIKSINLARDLKSEFDHARNNNLREINVHRFLNKNDMPICIRRDRQLPPEPIVTKIVLAPIFILPYLCAVSNPRMFWNENFWLMSLTILPELAYLIIEWRSIPSLLRLAKESIGFHDLCCILFVPFLASIYFDTCIFLSRLNKNYDFFTGGGNMVIGVFGGLSILSINLFSFFRLFRRLNESHSPLALLKKIFYAAPFVLPHLFYVSFFKDGLDDVFGSSWEAMISRYVVPLPVLLTGSMQCVDEIREYFRLKNPREEFDKSLMEEPSEESGWEYLARILELGSRPFYLLCFFMLSLLESNEPGAINNIGIALLYALSVMPRMTLPAVLREGPRPYQFLPRRNIFADQNRIVEVDEKDFDLDEENADRNADAKDALSTTSSPPRSPVTPP